MTVEQFDPANSSQTQARQTTTLDTPQKVIEEQARHIDHSKTQGSRIGFVSLGCLRCA
ncbi:hypothetical protein [Thalassotalea hakodatensis]|uniref:hypothetical protein n=1 Tax=Thalassotalea hakodatensis TaxID=3030492 RepID=UPI0025739D9D|nr:hypothetical protein [Thalassotalea hakodatensis]